MIDHTKVPFNVEILQLSVTRESLVEELNTFLYATTVELPKLSWWDMQVKLTKMGREFLRTFRRRLENWLLYLTSDVMYLYFLLPEWDEYYSTVLGKSTTLCETMGKADMWLIRTSWDFEFPYPYLPNFEFYLSFGMIFGLLFIVFDPQTENTNTGINGHSPLRLLYCH
ncbi:hypothetical protein HPG69_001425, partial [Diceros bicornis minor]